MVKYVVRLTEEERTVLTDVISKGKAAAQKIKHANVLLKLDADGPGWSDAQVAEAFACSPRTVFSLRQRCVEAGLDAALERKPRAQPPRERRLDGDGEAQLVRLACSTPPAGQAHWTLKLLAARLVELQVVATISPQTVMRTLKKTR
jgi:transposase